MTLLPPINWNSEANETQAPDTAAMANHPPAMAAEPFISALAQETVAETATALQLTDPADAVADLFEPLGDMVDQSLGPIDMLGSPIDDVHEIFYHARKLLEDDNRFVLDQIRFMEAIEPLPLFLRDGRS